ncbi:hypothetical protein HZ326_27146 [Fusarium oxysporum f. sp. albedinis]|nr:hypothetical protein HZ326_27146 [Fusarium oxysporum f. sp. albedinis]
MHSSVEGFVASRCRRSSIRKRSLKSRREVEDDPARKRPSPKISRTRRAPLPKLDPADYPSAPAGSFNSNPTFL